MSKSTIVAAMLVAGMSLSLGLGCKKPEPVPAPKPKVDDSDARARAETEARRKAEEEARRKREEQERAEKARLADMEKAKAFQRAAEAALKDIHFDYDQSDIKPEDKATLQGIADFMRSYPQAKLQVEGHCDERGTVEYNISLGDRRAASTVNYLVGLGSSRDRCSTISYGKERPLCTDPDESCWSRNRRAHFVLRK
ncbi:MAG: peptidoglycan-associated lipoprotein Pal [Acidobacteria bacterium]|nr:peptidoglycan-associated lipoprotein Pal [Acidobacteriota bacterium]